MSNYTGTFSVQNNTGSTITNVIVVHTCADFVNTIAAAQLANGQATPTSTLQSQTGSNDLWSVYYTLGSTLYYRVGKQCNYEQSDSPQNCSITLTVGEFSVNTPVSSSCTNNYMDSTSQG
ncbi:hypothetical protein [uncultured Sphingomonas sp.]|uniref:hypothetical protein n=1 Tax=uncultured Sphingomonas sp. TaxID=158754 RepID=UPI0025E70101|nr:hypothetical protein [uncultured Sphingomonas sp.]